MKKILAFLFCALLFSPTVSAYGTEWVFRYVGFYDYENSYFNPNWVISGSFFGEDLNYDGKIDKSELQYFNSKGINYVGCLPTTPYGYNCGISDFSLDLTTRKLDFYIWSAVSDPEHIHETTHSIEAGVSELSIERWGWSGSRWETHQWTPDTQSFISPVPEPKTVYLTLVGLLITALYARSSLAIKRPKNHLAVGV